MPVLVALPLVVVLSACQRGTAPIAKVDGKAVTSEHFLEGAALLDELSSQGPAATPPVKGATPTAQTANYVYFLVLGRVLDGEMSRLGLKVTAEERVTTEQALEQQYPGHAAANGAPAARAFKAFPDWFRALFVETYANYQAISEKRAAGSTLETQAQAYYKQYAATDFTSWCLDAVVAKDQAKADAAHTKVTSGADFSTVAKDTATADGAAAMGEAQDGNMGCDTPRSWVSNIGDASVAALQKLAVGGITPVIKVSDGIFVVLRLTKVEQQPFEQVRAQLLSSVREQDMNTYLGDLLKKAKVEVNPKFGTWSTSTGRGQVVPPAGAERAPSTELPTVLGGTSGTPTGSSGGTTGSSGAAGGTSAQS